MSQSIYRCITKIETEIESFLSGFAEALVRMKKLCLFSFSFFFLFFFLLLFFFFFSFFFLFSFSFGVVVLWELFGFPPSPIPTPSPHPSVGGVQVGVVEASILLKKIIMEYMGGF